jgi:glucose/mannose transport system substrate-binding protein
MKRVGLVASLAAAVALSAACSNSSSSSSGPTVSGQVEIFSWWVTGGEQSALTALTTLYTNMYPATMVINSAAANSSTAQSTLQTRLQAGDPPDAFQSNGGANLITYVGTSSADVAAKLEPLDSLASSEGWSFAPEVTQAMSFNGSLYAVPVDIARTNSIFYNISVFNNAGVAPPTGTMTWADFFTMCDALVAKGVTPIAIGLGQGSWTFQLPVMEGIFAGIVGAQYYTDYFTGKKAPDDPGMRQALALGTQLLSYSNFTTGNMKGPSEGWSDAADELKAGTAAMIFEGDWARGYLVAAQWKAGTDFGEVGMPAANPVFVFATDGFALPKGAPHPDNATALLKVFGSLAGQEAFNALKGGIPPRLDADTSGLDPLGQAMAVDFHTQALAPAESIILPSAFNTAVGNQLTQFATDGNVDAVMSVITANYSELGL